MQSYIQYYNLGIQAKKDGQLEASRDYHLRALEIHPEWDFPEAWHNAGAALLRLNQTDKAHKYLKKAIQLYQLKIEFGDKVAFHHYWKAAAHALLKEKKSMIQHLKKAIDLQEGYVKEVLGEEDFIEYKNDPELRAVLDPILTEIVLRQKRGEPIRKEDLDNKQLLFYKQVQSFLNTQGWDDHFANAFDSGQALSPQIRSDVGRSEDYRWVIKLFVDQDILFLILHPTDLSQYEKRFRLIYTTQQMLQAALNLLKEQFEQPDNWMNFLHKVAARGLQVQLEWPDGQLTELDRGQAPR